MSRLRTILCVDDNAALTDNLREILEDAQYSVRTAASCAEAIEKAKGGFDVALVDLRLPDGEGTELAIRLREGMPDAQVILLTGFATVESAAAAVRSGAWAYLMKPCSTPDLLLSVEQALRQVEVLREKRDLVRRTQVAEKLAAIGTLTAGLSHEIKNPLNAASLQLSVLERRLRKLPLDSQPALIEPLKLVQDEITRLNQVLEDFLLFARPRSLQPAEVDLDALLTHVVDLLAPQAERSAVRLERQWQGVPSISGDQVRLQQTVMNLVLNAIQATPAGGLVRVEARGEGRGIRLSIEDSGPGIPDDVRRRMFEPFFTTKSGGSGLGLPLVHSIIEQHGGTIEIDASRLGGASFVIRLPRTL